ncbi:putative oxidoreductase, partial [Stegodyphus mimosarum]
MPVTTSKGDFGPREVELSNYVKMPILGLGTSHSGGYSQDAVVYALKHCSYRLIDTAKRYGCEEFLRSAIELSGILRDDIFLTSKLWCTDYGSSSTKKAFQGSLKRLGVDYLDLFMLHWPLCPSSCINRAKTLEDTWRELELLYDEGLCRAIGVSNYDIAELEKLLDTASVTPHVNQVEFHPFQNPIELRKYCQEHKIQMEGYCPLGKGKLLGEKEVIRVAKSCSRTPAQVLIRWSIQNGVVTIPKSTQVER